MVELETVLQTIPALSVVVALLYYTITLRNMEKNRRKDFIFQSHYPRTPEYFEIFYMVTQMCYYETREEYDKKYSEEQRSRHNYLYNHFNVLGILIEEKVASVDEIFQLYPPHAIISIFELSWPLIRDLREDTYNPEFVKPFELLYQDAKRRPPQYIPSWQQNVSPTRALTP